jgi:phosphoenolpyruvate synthase/pyruvate phosphate dikinase
LFIVSDKMKITDISNDDLTYFGERIEPYFASSIILRGMLEEKNLKNVLHWKKGVRWVYTNNYFFILKKDLEEMQIELSKKFKKDGQKYATNLIKKCLQYGNHLIKTSKQIEQKSALKLTRKQMSSLLRKYVTAASNYMIFQNIALFENPISELSSELVKRYDSNETEEKELLNLITTSSKLTAGEAEQDDFLKLAFSKRSDKLISVHARKYSWLAMRFFVGEPWSKEYVFNRLNGFDAIKAKNDLAERVKHRVERENTIKLATKSFNSKDKSLVKLIRDIVYLRTQRTDFFQESSYYVLNLVKLIANELGVSYSDLLYLSATEVILALNGKFDYKTCITKRKEGFIVFFDTKEDAILESTSANEFIKKLSILNRNVEGLSEIIGKTGYGGKASGKAKIVKSDLDNSKVEKGDILVSMMTTPNFIPALERAIAFVTDEGGVTCHAAIIAREMKKPCVVGTKIATKVIQDGDFVEVDADKGIVKVIKKA